jgi:hypothetical protein
MLLDGIRSAVWHYPRLHSAVSVIARQRCECRALRGRLDMPRLR